MIRSLERRVLVIIAWFLSSHVKRFSLLFYTFYTISIYTGASISVLASIFLDVYFYLYITGAVYPLLYHQTNKRSWSDHCEQLGLTYQIPLSSVELFDLFVIFVWSTICLFSYYSEPKSPAPLLTQWDSLPKFLQNGRLEMICGIGLVFAALQAFLGKKKNEEVVACWARTTKDFFSRSFDTYGFKDSIMRSVWRAGARSYIY